MRDKDRGAGCGWMMGIRGWSRAKNMVIEMHVGVVRIASGCGTAVEVTSSVCGGGRGGGGGGRRRRRLQPGRLGRRNRLGRGGGCITRVHPREVVVVCKPRRSFLRRGFWHPHSKRELIQDLLHRVDIGVSDGFRRRNNRESRSSDWGSRSNDGGSRHRSRGGRR